MLGTVDQSFVSGTGFRRAWLNPFGVVSVLLVCIVLLSWIGDASAETIRLTGNTALGADHDVTLEEIDQIGAIEEKVYNPYEKLRVRYAGVMLDQFVARYGNPSVASVKFTAIDEYRITFEKSEWENFRIMLVTKQRGERFGLEDKGPARIVFPDFDPDEEAFLLNLPKWLWMIQEIEFK
tara:strand:- start:2346 stop:2885 length:540 start_codon:yes stop_codon:yes gene_type:complete